MTTKDIFFLLLGILTGACPLIVLKVRSSSKKKSSSATDLTPYEPGPDVNTQGTGGGPRPTKPV